LGNSKAMTNRAWLHAHGLGGDVNYSEAIKLYERAIALGHSKAMTNRAWLHAHGLGGDVNYSAAIKLYERAIALGNSEAMYRCGCLYLQKFKMYKKTRGFELFEKGAALGNVLCQSALSSDDFGNLYDEFLLNRFKQNKNINLLFIAIDKMELYASKTFAKNSEDDFKRRELFQLHSELSNKLKNFLLTSVRETKTTQSLETFKKEFIELANTKNKLMQTHRQQWKPIIANILFALTGIGLLAIMFKASLTKLVFKKPMSFNHVLFFAKTNSEALVANVVKNSGIGVDDLVYTKP